MSISGNVQLRQVSSENGQVVMKLTKHIEVETVAEALYYDITGGLYNQKALAELLSKDLVNAGYRAEDLKCISESQFSKMINDKTHPFYKYVSMFLSLLIHQKSCLSLQFIAESAGYRLTPKDMSTVQIIEPKRESGK